MVKSNWNLRKMLSSLVFIVFLSVSSVSASPASSTTWTAPAPTSSTLCPYNNNTIYIGPTDGQHYLVQCGVDRDGGDYNTSTTPQLLTDCINLCDQNPVCVSAAWVHRGTCHLKDTHQTPSTMAMWIRLTALTAHHLRLLQQSQQLRHLQVSMSGAESDLLHEP
jgi:hypothetical protein